MSIKTAKAYFLRRNTEVYESVDKQTAELRHRLSLFEKKGRAALEEQTEVVASGALERIKEEYNAVTKALAMFYEDCSEPLGLPVSKRQRRELKDSRAPFRVAFCAIRAAYRSGEINDGDTAMQMVAQGVVMRNSIKAFSAALSAVKRVMSAHIQSIAFTSIINNKELVIKYRIGQDVEGSREDEVDGAEFDHDHMVANDAPIEYDTRALTDEQLALKEARNLMRRTSTNGDAAVESSGDSGSERDKTSRELARLATRAHRVSYRTAKGKVKTRTLRLRSERQRSRMRAVVDFDASSDCESYDGGGSRRPAAAAINSESSDESFATNTIAADDDDDDDESDSCGEGTYEESGAESDECSDESATDSHAPKRRRLEKRSSIEQPIVLSQDSAAPSSHHSEASPTDSLEALFNT